MILSLIRGFSRFPFLQPANTAVWPACLPACLHLHRLKSAVLSEFIGPRASVLNHTHAMQKLSSKSRFLLQHAPQFSIYVPTSLAMLYVKRLTRARVTLSKGNFDEFFRATRCQYVYYICIYTDGELYVLYMRTDEDVRVYY